MPIHIKILMILLNRPNYLYTRKQEIGYGEIENILKTAGFILFFLKKIAPSPAKFRKTAGKVGIKLGKPP